jgi:hypothetical protein
VPIEVIQGSACLGPNCPISGTGVSATGRTGPPGPPGPPGPGEPPFYYDVVVDFGADPTGIVDAAPAINAAIATAAAVGQIRNQVYIPPGTYLIGSTITHLPNVTVFGTGPNTILRTAAGVSAWDFSTGFDRSELHHLTILGVFGAPAAVGINLDQAQRCFIHDVQVWDFQIGILISSGLSFSAYNTVGPNVEVNRSTVVGIRALANANVNKVVGSRVFFTYNNTDTGIALDISDAEVLEIDDCALEAADFCIRVRNTTGLTRVDIHDCYLEPGTNPTTATIGSCYDIFIRNLFDGIETLYLRNNTESGVRGTIDVPPEMLAEIDGYSQAFFGARFSGQAVPKRNYVYNGQVLYYGLPSVLPGWGTSGTPPTLASDPTHVTGDRSLRATATAVDSNVSCGFTVSDEGVEWVTCGIRFQILPGNTGFFFSGTVGANSRQYVPDPLPVNTWRTAWVNVPVDPTNSSGALGCVIDSVGGAGSILIDEIWAVPGKYAIPSTQYGERIQFLPAPIPILTRAGIVANEVFGPIDILTLPSTLAPPLDEFSTAPAGVVGAIVRLSMTTDPGGGAVLVNQHTTYLDIPASGAVVAASNEFLTAVYGQLPASRNIVVRDTTLSGGYFAGDGFPTDYTVSLIGWILA